MALASDLMGLGLPPLIASHIAEGGIGPLTITAAGTTFATSTRLGVNQQVVACSTAGGSAGAAIALPAVGGDNGCLLADPFVVCNTTSSQSLVVYASSGVVITGGATQDSKITVPVFTTMLLTPLSTTSWGAIKGA